MFDAIAGANAASIDLAESEESLPKILSPVISENKFAL
jgi:hypothetical protein